MGGAKTIQEVNVKLHYQLLMEDINNNEADRIAMRNYDNDLGVHEFSPATTSSRESIVDEKSKGGLHTNIYFRVLFRGILLVLYILYAKDSRCVQCDSLCSECF